MNDYRECLQRQLNTLEEEIKHFYASSIFSLGRTERNTLREEERDKINELLGIMDKTKHFS